MELGVNKPGNALLPLVHGNTLWLCFTEQHHSRQKLPNRKLPQEGFQTPCILLSHETPNLHCPKGNNLAHLLHQYPTPFFPISQTIMAATCQGWKQHDRVPQAHLRWAFHSQCFTLIPYPSNVQEPCSHTLPFLTTKFFSRENTSSSLFTMSSSI